MLEKFKFGFKEFIFAFTLWLWAMLDDGVVEHFWAYLTESAKCIAILKTTTYE